MSEEPEICFKQQMANKNREQFEKERKIMSTSRNK
ncbi:hypothetical protein Geoth_2762 [Parageobacillus thermoglucosidasius C56-YS93]|nr:hypothetical protein Geoth_2762 [Parageobacillus thermoglucosidasius C56-YS93]